MQGSLVLVVSHEEFVVFQDKVLSMLASFEAKVDARDKEIRQELALFKTALTAWSWPLMKHHEWRYRSNKCSMARGMPRIWITSCGKWSGTFRGSIYRIRQLR